jgi:hypothetical protein
MAVLGASSPIEFFKNMCRIFGRLLTSDRDGADPIGSVVLRAYETFEVQFACEAAQEIKAACHSGCASCCTIRVTATAPEILNIAREIRRFPDFVSPDLTQRVLASSRATRLLSQQQRMASGLFCPLIENNFCLIYPARPLACRSHVSFDEQACRYALNGGLSEVPVSAFHLKVRSLVQNAMQSALRDANLAWGSYELNHALRIALSDETCEKAWIAGVDVFAPALITDVSLEEMADTFDAIKAMAG